MDEPSPFIQVIEDGMNEGEGELGGVYLRQDGGIEAQSAAFYSEEPGRPFKSFPSFRAAVRWILSVARHG